MSAPGTSDEIFQWFRAHKVQISYAIKDTFPFLNLLRDKKMISEKDFKNWLDKVTAKPDDINKVVYDVLKRIQTKVSAIEEIFCKENLEAYPNLQPLYESLENGKGMQNNKIQDLNVGVRTLKVRCGRSKGVLYKTRFTAGVSTKCIKGSDGKWLTLSEFKAKGGYKCSTCWRRCIHYDGVSLPVEAIIKWGEILKSRPESSRMQKPDDLCGVSCVCCEEKSD